MGTVTDITSMKKKPSHVKKVVRGVTNPFTLLVFAIIAFVQDHFQHQWMGWNALYFFLILWGAYAISQTALELYRWSKE